MNPKYTRASLATGIAGLVLQLGCYALANVFADRARAHLPVPPDWVGYALVIGVLAGSVLVILAFCDLV